MEPGSVIDKYRIVKLLGKGGMGEVYLAEDVNLGRQVALKLMLLVDTPDIAKRFGREAKAVAALNHPNIIQIYDYAGSETGHPFIVNEYLNGWDFQVLVKSRGAFPIDLGIMALHELALALDYAHGKGIIHRDIKPSNIMLTTEGRIVLMDFGLAKLYDQSGELSDPGLMEEITMASKIVGSPSYMSPEQILNRRLDGRADIFALGCVAYTYFTGEKPFKGKHLVQVFGLTMKGKYVDPMELRPDLDPRLALIINRCMETRRTRRYQHASEILRDLTSILEDMGIVDVRVALKDFIAGNPKWLQGLPRVSGGTSGPITQRGGPTAEQRLQYDRSTQLATPAGVDDQSGVPIRSTEQLYSVSDSEIQGRQQTPIELSAPRVERSSSMEQSSPIYVPHAGDRTPSVREPAAPKRRSKPGRITQLQFAGEPLPGQELPVVGPKSGPFAAKSGVHPAYDPDSRASISQELKGLTTSPTAPAEGHPMSSPSIAPPRRDEPPLTHDDSWLTDDIDAAMAGSFRGKTIAVLVASLIAAALLVFIATKVIGYIGMTFHPPVPEPTAASDTASTATSAETSTTTTVTLTSSHTGTLLLDGKEVGSLPALERLSLEPGIHELQLRIPDEGVMVKVLDVKAGGDPVTVTF